jgi:hypothetical protein
LCPILEKLSNKLQSYKDAAKIIDDIFISKNGNDTRVLNHLLSYANHQFGELTNGKNYRERRDGQRISNWEVDINILMRINYKISDIFLKNNSISTLIKEEKSFPYLQKTIHLIDPYMIQLDLDATTRRDGINIDKKITY